MARRMSFLVMPQSVRYRIRSGVEMTNARRKDEFGARHVLVRGHAKDFGDVMSGVPAPMVDRLMRFAVPPWRGSPSLETVPASAISSGTAPKKAGERSGEFILCIRSFGGDDENPRNSEAGEAHGHAPNTRHCSSAAQHNRFARGSIGKKFVARCLRLYDDL